VCVFNTHKNIFAIANQFWVSAGKKLHLSTHELGQFLVNSQACFFTATVFLRVSNPFICKYSPYARSVLKYSTTEQHMSSHFCFFHTYHSIDTAVFGTSSKEPCQNRNIKIVKNHQFQFF